MFGERYRMGNIGAPRMNPIVVDNVAGTRRVNPRKERGPRRVACRRRTDCIGKHDPALSEPFNVRRDGLRVAFKYAVPVVPIVDVNK